ncbi:MAG: glycosyltransferase family 2 protein [Neisseria sp.]|nr:glycosyltransferase family 2 protein [Neisseria sp.]
MRQDTDVIIPCYRAAATLRRAAESALAQPGVRAVWLVDDASDDDTAGVMRRLAAEHPRICCEFLPQNGGAARARNWGLLNSDAAYAAFLDADDEYEGGVLEAARMALDHVPQLAMVRLRLQPDGFPERYTRHEGFPKAWQRLAMTVGGNTVFRRTVLLACGGFPQHGLFRRFGGEDAALGIALTRAGVVGTLFDPRLPAVRHRYRPGIHAERLLDAELFGIPPADVDETHRAQAEEVTQAVCAALAAARAAFNPPQTGIMPLQVSFSDGG